MKTRSKLLCGWAVAALLSSALPASATITYQLNRTVGAATLTGYIVTDGKLGSLAPGDFVDWSLKMVAPDVNGGAPSQFTPSSPFYFNGDTGALSATSSSLLFDFSKYALFWSYSSSRDFWCLAGGGQGGCFAQGEVIGFSDLTGRAAYVDALSGVVAFGSAVPEPPLWALLAAGLLAGLSRWGREPSNDKAARKAAARQR